MAEQNKAPEPTDQPPEIEADLPLPQQAAEETKADKDDSVGEKIKKTLPGTSHWQRFRGWYKGHKKISFPLTFLVLLLLLLAVPFTRYSLAGLVLKKNITVQVLDSTTLAPVSGADVRSGAASGQTDGSGKAILKLKPGNQIITVSKKYYRDGGAKVLVPVLSAKKTPEIKLQATGRQVKINVKNSITKKPLAEANIKVSDIAAKTDKEGNALVVLPAGSGSQKATLSLSGYNDAEVKVNVSENKVEENEFTITPAGKIYFLSKLSGKIDVVKSNLDGTKRETVLGGTGREDDQNTVLLASRDWKYLALLSRRDSDLAKLYLVETSSDKVTAIDEGNATFDPIGWSDTHFVYQVNRRGYQLWQSKQSALKSYDALAKQITPLGETDASGSTNSDAKYENFTSAHIVGQRLVYVKSWYFNSDSDTANDNQLGIYSISAAGSGGRSTHKTFEYQAGSPTYEQSFLQRPDQVYFQVVEKGGDAKYYTYANNQLSEKTSIKDEFNDYLNSGQYNTYLQSPSGNATFWSEFRDGKNSLFTGDGQGANQKEVAKLSDYQTYGWYTEDYLLVSKDNSELYVFSGDGIKKDADALKITDYHRSVMLYMGYGGGL